MHQKNPKGTLESFIGFCCFILLTKRSIISAKQKFVKPGNFGLPGIIDLPTAKRFTDGELVLTHQNHKYLFMNGISFQAMPRLGVSFRYAGHGSGGVFAQDRINWDRSF